MPTPFGAHIASVCEGGGQAVPHRLVSDVCQQIMAAGSVNGLRRLVGRRRGGGGGGGGELGGGV
jgi:hypothetical protein